MKKKGIYFQYAKINLYGNAPFWVQVMEENTMHIYKGLVIDPACKYFNQVLEFPLDSVTRYIHSHNPQLKGVSGLNSPYIPASESCAILDTIVPDSMDYETHVAVRKIKEAVGHNLVEFVCDRLKFSASQLCKALAAEQVDAVAMAIYNIEAKNQGIIIGDQTGIGKGRIAAAMLRYGHMQGLKPVFISEKPNLFSDIYRDLVDIGADDGIAMEITHEEPTLKKIRYAIWDKLSDDEKQEYDNDPVKYQEYIVNPDNQYEEIFKRSKNKQFDLTTGTRLRPLIINSRSSKTNIIDKNGNLLYTGIESKDLATILDSKKIPDGYDVVLATYSQFNSAKRSLKRDFLAAISADNIIIMDEAHNASGTSNTGEYLQKILSKCRGVTFLSATFAKRPDNMPIYAKKTAMSDVNLNSDQLVSAIIDGGVALQEVLSSQLVSEGQMLRRERSFEGIEVNYITLTEQEYEHRAISDSITQILRDIISFQQDYLKEKIKSMDKRLAKEGKEVKEAGGTSKAGIDSPPYFSKIHNVISQMLFSIKAESVAERAITRLKEGKKPIIAFSSTMGAFLETLETQDGNEIQPGDIINTDFATVLMRGLDGVMRYTVKDHAGNGSRHSFALNEIGQEGLTEYFRIAENIRNSTSSISISPIDQIITLIEAAGYTVAEITGRKLEVIFDTKKASNRKDKISTIVNGLGRTNLDADNKMTGVVMNRKRMNTNDAFRLFNNNEVDVLMINQSGSTGASAHAIVTDRVPLDKVKQRVMIILQAELNINTEVQKRGRINRTGQVYKPIYDYVNSAIPAERRQLMILQKKLKSLDANTTSNQNQSEKILQSDDFLNKYGDDIVYDYLEENPELNLLVGDILKKSSEQSGQEVTKENISLKASGRVAVLSCEQQEKFYTEIIEKYDHFVKNLKNKGEYDLEVETMNLDAETLQASIKIAGLPGKTSVFAADTILERCRVNNLRKPYTKDLLLTMISEALAGKTVHDHKTELKEKYKSFVDRKLADDIGALNKRYEKNILAISEEKQYIKLESEEDRLSYYNKNREEIEAEWTMKITQTKENSTSRFEYLDNIFGYFGIGKGYNYPLSGVNVPCIFLGYSINESKQNPFAPSSVSLRFALANSHKVADLVTSGNEGNMVQAIIGASTWLSPYSSDEYSKNWENYIKNASVTRKECYIFTGNILQAFGEYKGHLINYTTNTGSIKKGILMPDGWSPEIRRGVNLVTLPISKCRKIIFEMYDTGVYHLQSSTGLIIEKNMRDSWVIILPKSKTHQEFYKDPDLIALSVNPQDGFNSVSNKMIASFYKDEMNRVIDILQNKFQVSLQIDPEIFKVNVNISTEESIQGKNTETINAENEYQKDKAAFEFRKNPASCTNVFDIKKKIAIAKARARARLRISI